jgi:hypothetical protein
MIRIIIIIAILTALWIGYKMLKAGKVKGRKAEVSPFRQNSRLAPLGTITVTLNEIQRKGEDIWFVCPLETEHALGELTFDYIMLKAKSDDDDLNTKKPVVAYVMAGHSKNVTPPQFIDWGLVKVL